MFDNIEIFKKILKKCLTNHLNPVIIYWSADMRVSMRVQFNGRIPAFQAGRVGSIPITRSIMCLQLSWIEQLPSKQWAGGSNPSRHARMFKGQVSLNIYFMVGIVQLVRASDCGPECRGFESHYPPHFIIWIKIKLCQQDSLLYRDIAKSVRHQILILAFVGSSPAIPARAISSVGRALDF